MSDKKEKLNNSSADTLLLVVMPAIALIVFGFSVGKITDDIDWFLIFGGSGGLWYMFSTKALKIILRPISTKKTLHVKSGWRHEENSNERNDNDDE